MKDKTIQRVLAVFAVVIAVLVFVAIIATRNIARAAASSDWVNHTHAVITEADAIVSTLQLGDGTMRTYLLAGDARDKGAARDAFNDTSEHFELMRALLGEAGGERITQLAGLLNTRMEFARQVIAARDAGEQDKLQKLLAADGGGETLHEISHLLEKLKLEQQALLTERDKASFLQAETTRWTVYAGVGINFLLLAGAAWLVRDDIAARQRATRVLEEANATLDLKVKERTAELLATNEKLVAENQERKWGGQALEHQLRYNQLIINSISELVLVTTKTLKISRINPAVSRRTGLQASDLVNAPVSRVVQVITPPGALEPLSQALREGRELQDQRATVTAGDGRSLPARLCLIPLRDRDKVVGAVLTIHLDSIV